MGCGNYDVLRGCMLVEGGAAAFVAAAFFDFVLFARGLADSDGTACEEDHRRARWQLDTVLVAGMGV